MTEREPEPEKQPEEGKEAPAPSSPSRREQPFRLERAVPDRSAWESRSFPVDRKER